MRIEITRDESSAANNCGLLGPVSQLFRHAINDIGINGINGIIASLVLWWAHDHLVNQSVEWFQEDLTERTAVHLLVIGTHVSDII